MLITREDLALRRIFLDQSYVEFDIAKGEASLCGPVRIAGWAELAGEDIRIHGRIDTCVRSSCDRCTEPVEIPVGQDFDVTYRPVSEIAKDEEIEIPAGELDVGFYEGDGVELDDVIREQVLLALPMKVVCRPDCQGLCPVCGANRNLESCRCQQPKSESPFSGFLKNV